ncbi:MAG: HDOD domain-containing protein, partial [Acidobacteriota bacterium]
MKQRLPLDALEPGMILAADLRREDGILLLPRGTALTPRQLALLPSWQVADDAAWIKAPAPTPPATETPPAVVAEPPPDLTAAAEALAPRFVHCDLEDLGQSALFSVSLPRAARLLASQGPSALALPAPAPQENLPPLPD